MLEIKNGHSELHLHPPEGGGGGGGAVRDREVKRERQMDRPRQLTVPHGFAVHPKAGKKKGKGPAAGCSHLIFILFHAPELYLFSGPLHTHTLTLSLYTSSPFLHQPCQVHEVPGETAAWQRCYHFLLPPLSFLSAHVCNHADVQCGQTAAGLKDLMSEKLCLCIAPELSYSLEFFRKICFKCSVLTSQTNYPYARVFFPS